MRWSDLSAADALALLCAPGSPWSVLVAQYVLTELIGRRALRAVAVRVEGVLAPRSDVLAFLDGGAAPPATGLAADAWAAYRSRPFVTFADGTRGVEVRSVARSRWHGVMAAGTALRALRAMRWRGGAWPPCRRSGGRGSVEGTRSTSHRPARPRRASSAPG